MLLIHELQTYTAPDIFQPPAAYDGRKNMFSIQEFPFGGLSSKEVRLSQSLLANLNNDDFSSMLLIRGQVDSPREVKRQRCTR